MGFHSRSRNRRLRDFASRKEWNNGADRILGNWELIDIHVINSPIDYGAEFDFWCSNQEDMYLRRVRRAREKKYAIAKSQFKDAPIYLIAEVDCEVFDNDLIAQILEDFESIGIPKWRPHKMNLRLKLS